MWSWRWLSRVAVTVNVKAEMAMAVMAMAGWWMLRRRRRRFIGLARNLHLHTMVHCLCPQGNCLMVSSCSSGCTVSQALAGGKSATASLPLSALRDRKVRIEKGFLPRSGAISSTSGKGGVHLTLLKVLSRGRYSPSHSTEGKGMGSPQPPSPEYKVYTSTLSALWLQPALHTFQVSLESLWRANQRAHTSTTTTTTTLLL